MSIYFGRSKGIPGWIQKPVFDRLLQQLLLLQSNDYDDDQRQPQRRQPTKMGQILEYSNQNKRILLVSDGHHSIILVLEDDSADDNQNNNEASLLHRGTVISIKDWNIQVRTIMHDGETDECDIEFYKDPFFQRYAITRNNNNNNSTEKLAIYIKASQVICQGGQDLALAAMDPIHIFKDIDIRRALQSFQDHTYHNHQDTVVARPIEKSYSPAVAGILSRAQNRSSSSAVSMNMYTTTHASSLFLERDASSAIMDLSLGNVAALFPNNPNAPPPPSNTTTTTATAQSSPSSSFMPMGNVAKLFESITLQRHVIPELLQVAELQSQEQRYDAMLLLRRQGTPMNIPVPGGTWQHRTQREAAMAPSRRRDESSQLQPQNPPNNNNNNNNNARRCTTTTNPISNNNNNNNNNNHRQAQQQQQHSRTKPSTRFMTPTKQPDATTTTTAFPTRLSSAWDDAADSPSTTTTTNSVRNIIASHRQYLHHDDDDDNNAERLSCDSSTSSDEEDENMGIVEMLDPEPFAKEIERSNCTSDKINKADHFTSKGSRINAVEKDESRQCETATLVRKQHKTGPASSVTSLGVLKDVKSNTLKPPSVLPLPVDPYTNSMKKNVNSLIDRNTHPGMESTTAIPADEVPLAPPPKKKKKKFQFGADRLRAFLSDN
jgi:hypothetical protein